jgi:hypothetical protein
VVLILVVAIAPVKSTIPPLHTLAALAEAEGVGGLVFTVAVIAVLAEGQPDDAI